MNMAYTFKQKVLFKHCDPAGIVFYPRYFEMINDAVEHFFADVLNAPFEDMHPNEGVPAIAIDVNFLAPSRHGDHLKLVLKPLNVGKTSLTLSVKAICGEQVRFEANITVVHVEGPDLKPSPWSQAHRALLMPLLNASEESPNVIV
jgi:4-hydroxybenzoyl-CoA thioesterase